MGSAYGVRQMPSKAATKVEWPEHLKTYAAEHLLTLADMWMPPKGPAAELKTLRRQTNDARAVDVDDTKLSVSAARAASWLPRTSAPDYKSDNAFLSCLFDLKRSSVPGYPAQQFAKEIADVLDNPVELRRLHEVVKHRIAELERFDPELLRKQLLVDPTFALRHNLADPVKIIIKQAPHSEAKIVDQRWRFLLVLSLADQIVERLAFSRQNKAEIASWRHIPSKPGMGMDDEDIAYMQEFVTDCSLNVSSDASMWDCLVFEQALYADARRRVMCSRDPPQGWVNIVYNISVISAQKVILLSDGSLYVREVPGAMASGRYVTSSSNSAIRTICDLYVEASAPDHRPCSMTMGDDAVSRVSTTKEEYARRFAALGMKLTDLKDADGTDFEFCSHRYTPAGAEHLNPLKSIAAVVALGGGDFASIVSRQASLDKEWRSTPNAAVYQKLLRLAAPVEASLGWV